MTNLNITKETYCIGIDLAKDVFHLCAIDEKENQLYLKKLSRKKLLSFISTHEKVIVAMEACSGANYFARKFREYGHEVKIMPAQYVKPYVKTNKNDFIDAAAICEAALRPNMRFVPLKKKWQHNIIHITKSRARLLKNRTAI
jgi:transposase